MASLKKTVQETLSINGLDVAIRGNGDENDYISLTDLAREKVGPEGDPRFAIGNWMRLKDTIALLGIWEKLNNPDFKRVEFDTFMGEAGRNAFTMTPSRWITATNAIASNPAAGAMAAHSLTWTSPSTSPHGSVPNSDSTYSRNTSDSRRTNPVASTPNGTKSDCSPP